MRSRPTPDRNLANPMVASTPSVPISVYRELAAELQAAKALSASLKAQNQQLLRQNQQLRQELNKAIDSVLYWRNTPKNPHRLPQTQADNHNSPPSPSNALPLFPKTAKSPEITEQEQGRTRYPSPERATEISSWSLAIAILLIMVTAFGAGYFMMRPMVRSR
jgi:hypothetical protein